MAWYSQQPDKNGVIFTMGAKLPPDQYKNLVCGYCSSVMSVTKNCTGILSWQAAKTAYKDRFDQFDCPNVNQSWHRQIEKITAIIHSHPSKVMRDLMTTECQQILQTKTSTVIV